MTPCRANGEGCGAPPGDRGLLNRKQFIRTFALATASSTLFGKTWRHLVAAQIDSVSPTTGIMRIRLQDFPALQSESGSLRIAINPVNGNSGPNGTFYPVIINRGANNAFFALNSRCMHQGCIVEAMDPSTNEMTCFCHGSVYGIDGRRISGPTPSALSKYVTAFDGVDLLKIQIPNLGYSVTAVSVQPVAGGAQRFRLSFRSFRNIDYEVQFRESLAADPMVVPFSDSATGPADQMIFTARAGSTSTLYVESSSTAGFYTVAIRLSEI